MSLALVQVAARLMSFWAWMPAALLQSVWQLAVSVSFLRPHFLSLSQLALVDLQVGHWPLQPTVSPR